MKNNKYARHIYVCLLFTAILFIFESVYLPFVPEQKDFSAQLGGYFLSLVSLVLMFFFIYSAASSPYSWRLVYFLIFSLATVTEYGYYSALQQFSTAEDLENVIFGTNLDNKLDAAMIYFNPTGFVPCLFFLILLFAAKPIYQKGVQKFALISLAGVGFFLTTGYLTNNYFSIIFCGASYRTLIGSPFKLNYLSQTPRQLIEYQATEKPNKNLVLIIDESIGGRNLSLNGYERQTTPFLDELNEKG